MNAHEQLRAAHIAAMKAEASYTAAAIAAAIHSDPARDALQRAIDRVV